MSIRHASLGQKSEPPARPRGSALERPPAIKSAKPEKVPASGKVLLCEGELDPMSLNLLVKSDIAAAGEHDTWG
jgi:hypothetical protein